MTLSNHSLPRSTPEAQGVSSQGILDFVQAAEANIHELHSFMLVRHGKVIAEGWWSPYAAERLHMLFSLSKSFTSTAVGFAVSENRLTVDDKVLSFFPDDAPETVSENLAAMRVRDLLSMSTGHTTDTTAALHASEDGNWTKAFLAQPVEREPGTFFLYNTGATYMLAAIVQKLTGEMLIDYLKPRLLEPLGIEDSWWEVSPQGVNTGGYGYNVHTEAIAKFCQLYLQKGEWNGQQVIPQAWVEEATGWKISNGDDPNSDWAQGYAYQFWRCRHGAYRGDGAFGQYGVVLPEQDAVLAITSGLGDMQPPLDLVWKHLLPAMQDAPLPENPATQAKLTEKLGSLAILPPQGEPSSPLAANISGQAYKLEPNPLGIDTVTLEFTEHETAVSIKTFFGEHTVRAGIGTWVEGEVAFMNRTWRYVAASTWSAENTLSINFRLVETPFYFAIVATFTGKLVSIEAKINQYFVPVNYTLVGQRV